MKGAPPPPRRLRSSAMEQAKRMRPEDFRREGYLAEVNRRVLHPLGLALGVHLGAGAPPTLFVVDHRDDPEGIVFDPVDGPSSQDVRQKAAAIGREWEERRAAREKALGYMIQPIVMGDGDVVRFPGEAS